MSHLSKDRQKEEKVTREHVRAYRGVGPQGALAAVAAGSAWGAGVLAEVVVASDGLSAEVTHEAAAAARHSVAALRLDQASTALDALPHPSCRHPLLTVAQETWTDRDLKMMNRGVRDKKKFNK